MVDAPRSHATTPQPASPDVTAPVRYQPSANVVFRSVGEDVVMLDLENGTYFSLNETGSQIWVRLCSGQTPDQVVQAIADAYETDRDTVATDVQDTVRRLVDAGLLQPASA